MVTNSPSLGRKPEIGLRRRVSRLFGGGILVVLYFVVGYLVVFSFTAYQIQQRIQDLSRSMDGPIASVVVGVSSKPSPGNTVTAPIGNLTVWKVVQFFETASDIELLKANLKKVDSDYQALEAQDQQNEARYFASKSSLWRRTTEVEAEIQMKKWDAPQTSGEPPDRAMKMKIYFKNAGSAIPEMTLRSRELDESLDEYFKALLNRELSTRQIRLLGEKKQAMLTSLSNKTPPPEVRYVLRELEFFKSGGLNSLGALLASALGLNDVSSYLSEPRYNFIAMPGEVLVLIIVLVMGMLGSMITMTQEFFSGANHPVSFYLFRPLLGAIVALGVYVILRAGVIVVTDQSAISQAGAPLNAFFLAFVALISGLMSEPAIETIKSAGSSFLRGGSEAERPRYAVRLKEVIEGQNKRTDKLKAFFDVDQNTVDRWIGEKDRVPWQAQRTIAAWLEMPVRDLFSDLPSDGSPPVAGQPPAN